MDKKIFKINIGRPREMIKDFKLCKECIVSSCCSTICEEGLIFMIEDIMNRRKQSINDVKFVDYIDIIKKD